MWVIDKSWLMQESSGLKLDWCWDIRSFSKKNPSVLLNINRSKIFLHIGSKDIGRYLFERCLSFFLWAGTILPLSQSDENIPFATLSLNLSSTTYIMNSRIFSTSEFANIIMMMSFIWVNPFGWSLICQYIQILPFTNTERVYNRFWLKSIALRKRN